MRRVTLIKIKKNTKVKIVEVGGGKLMALRLSSLGLRPGMWLTKISAFALRGPVTVKVGQTTLALGHGMAEKIFVESHA